MSKQIDYDELKKAVLDAVKEINIENARQLTATALSKSPSVLVVTHSLKQT